MNYERFLNLIEVKSQVKFHFYPFSTLCFGSNFSRVKVPTKKGSSRLGDSADAKILMPDTQEYWRILKRGPPNAKALSGDQTRTKRIPFRSVSERDVSRGMEQLGTTHGTKMEKARERRERMVLVASALSAFAQRSAFDFWVRAWTRRRRGSRGSQLLNVRKIGSVRDGCRIKGLFWTHVQVNFPKKYEKMPCWSVFFRDFKNILPYIGIRTNFIFGAVKV